MPKKRRNKNWSYNAGERGRNWVRAYRQKRDGRYYVEWLEDGRRRAVLLKGVTDPAEAKKRADELAARFADLVLPAGPLTVRSLMTIYMKEVTPTKKAEGSREYDTRAEPSGECFLTPNRAYARVPGIPRPSTGSIGTASWCAVEKDGYPDGVRSVTVP